MVCIEDIDGREASRKVKDNFEFTIRERIQKTIEYHKSYTRIPEWGGSTEDSKIDIIAEKIQSRERKRRSSDISAMSEILMSIQRRGEMDTSTRSLDIYDRSPSNSPPRRGLGVGLGGIDNNDLSASLSALSTRALNTLNMQSPLTAAFEITGIPEALDENADAFSSSGFSFADDDGDDDDGLAGIDYEEGDGNVNVVYNDNEDDIENGISYGTPSQESNVNSPLSNTEIQTGGKSDGNTNTIEYTNNYGSISTNSSGGDGTSRQRIDSISSDQLMQRMDSISSDQRNFMAAVQQYDAVPRPQVMSDDSRSRTFSYDTRVTVDSTHQQVQDLQNLDTRSNGGPSMSIEGSINVAQPFSREDSIDRQMRVLQDRTGVESGSVDEDILSSIHSIDSSSARSGSRNGSLGRFRLPRTPRTPRSPFKRIKSAFKGRKS